MSHDRAIVSEDPGAEGLVGAPAAGERVEEHVDDRRVPHYECVITGINEQ